jgi:outer membrane protein
MKLKFLTTAFFLFASALCFAQEKIAVVDGDRVVANAQIAKKAIADLKAYKESIQKQIDQKQGQLLALQDKAKLASTMNDEARNKLADQIDDGKRELQRFIEDSQADMEKRRDRTLGPIEDMMISTVKKIAEAKGYSAVLSKGIVLYSREDITDEVIRALDSQATPPPAKPKP